MKLYQRLNIKQSGIALIVALLLLFIITIASLLAANNSALELKMSGNWQDSLASYQSAEAGAMATLALSGTAQDPFDRVQLLQDPFDDWLGANPPSVHPLDGIFGGSSSVNVSLTLLSQSNSCPKYYSSFSAQPLRCAYYDIASEHSIANKIKTKVHLGIVKAFINDVQNESTLIIPRPYSIYWYKEEQL